MFTSKTKKKEVPELNMLPIMSLFAILIPFLLSVAQFERLGILELTLPERNDAPTAPTDVDPNLMNLAVIINDQTITLGAAAGFMPSIYYQEEVEYRSRSDGHVFRKVWGGKDEEVRSPTDNRVMSPYERETIHLHALTKKDSADAGTFTFIAVNAFDEALLKPDGEWYTTIPQPGESYRRIGSETMFKMDGATAQNCKIEKLSAYQQLAYNLEIIHRAYSDKEDLPKDIDDITVLGEPNTIYDKVIQVMDAAKNAGYDRVSLSLLQGGES